MKLPVNASEESRRLANTELIDGRKRTARLFKLDGMRMSLSKPFRLFDLPLLPLEQVLLLTEPKALLFFALSSEKARELLRKFSLVKYFDIRVIFNAVIFSIRFKSRKPIKWKFYKYWPVNASEECRLSANTELKLNGMRMVLWETMFEYFDEMSCILPKEHFIVYTQRIGYFLQSICPGKRIRKLVTEKVESEEEKVLFHMDGITSCEKFRFDLYKRENVLEILEKTDVKRKITLKSDQFEFLHLEWMNNEKIRNIPELKLVWFDILFLSQFLSFENEHLHVKLCTAHSLPNEFLKKWVNGEFTKRRTLRVTSRDGNRLDDTVLNGLTQEPVETWEELGKPGLVRFSDRFYLKPIPREVPGKYQTVLLKNCRGQFATVVQTRREFYFTRWDLPLPPINIPKGRELCEYSAWPVAVLLFRNV